MCYLTNIYCHIDDYYILNKKEIIQAIKKHSKIVRYRESRLSIPEIISILIYFHKHRTKDFRNFYNGFVLKYLKEYFPNLLSYTRFMQIKNKVIAPLVKVLGANNSKKTGIYFIDSSPLKVCHIKRAKRHKTFDEVASYGKSSMGFYKGFKIHLIINEIGEIINYRITKSNVDDRKVAYDLARNISGKLYADKGYISRDLVKKLAYNDLELIHNVRSNMNDIYIADIDKLMLKKRFIIETVFGKIKQSTDIENSRHRSLNGFIITVLTSLISYNFEIRKPSVKNVVNFSA